MPSSRLASAMRVVRSVLCWGPGGNAMRHRTFGRLGWQVSEVGCGMWGLAGWSGRDDDQSRAALQLAVGLGCNFFDTALAYGEGDSERLLGGLVRANPGRNLFTATKVPPKDG